MNNIIHILESTLVHYFLFIYYYLYYELVLERVLCIATKYAYFLLCIIASSSNSKGDGNPVAD